MCPKAPTPFEVREHLELFGRIKGIPRQAPSACVPGRCTWSIQPLWSFERSWRLRQELEMLQPCASVRICAECVIRWCRRDLWLFAELAISPLFLDSPPLLSVKARSQDLSLSPHVDKLSMTLSGGNKSDLAWTCLPTRINTILTIRNDTVSYCTVTFFLHDILRCLPDCWVAQMFHV